MAEKTVSVRFRSETPSILAWPALFTPRAYQDKKRSEPGRPQFQSQFLYRINPQHADIAGFNAAMRAAAKEMWGDDKVAPNDKGQMVEIDYPYELGDKIADKAKADNKDREAFRGYIVIRATSPEKNPVALGAVHNGVPTDAPQAGPGRTEFEKYFYGGCLVQFEINFFPMLSFGAPHVHAYLNTVFSLNSGEPVKAFSAGATRSAAASFGSGAATHVGHVGQASAINPMG